MKKKLKKSKDKVFYGVCSGLGEHFNIDPNIVRILFVILPYSLLVYVAFVLLLEDSK